MIWKIETVSGLRGYSVEWAEPGNYYLSRRNELYHTTDLKPPFRRIGAVAAPDWKQMASRFRLAQRLLRFSFYNVIPLKNNEIFVTFDKTVGVFHDGNYLELSGLVRPCRVLRSGCTVDENGDVFFGEYLANDDRGEMHIYRCTPGRDRLEIAYTFPAGTVRHIHGLYADEFTGSLLCLTGDAGDECRMLKTTDGFQSLQTIGQGDETWRAVSILFTRDHLYYGTDAEHRDNEIFQINRKTLERKSLGQVTGTVFYSKKIGDDLFFGTTAENAPSQKENTAALYHLDRDNNLTKLTQFQKDPWPAGLFQFGTIQFPTENHFQDRLYLNLTATTGEQNTYCLSGFE